jgi:hypothetical protein
MDGGVDYEDDPHDTQRDEGAAGEEARADDGPDNKFQTAIGAWRSMSLSGIPHKERLTICLQTSTSHRFCRSSTRSPRTLSRTSEMC